MKFADELYYNQEHEWVRVEGDLAYMGITDYAQRHLGDVVFVDLPEIGEEFVVGDCIGVIESVKAVADMHAVVSGTLEAVNEALEENPELLNKDPYGQHIAVVKMSNPQELEDFMDSSQYAAFCTGKNK